MKLTVLLLLLSSLITQSFAQKIDHLMSYRSPNPSKYFRISYDNDFFTATDRNYTQGYSFELVTPGLSKNPINYVLPKFENTSKCYGIVLETIGFTPRNIASTDIQYGDRPFSAAAMIKSFLIQTNSDKEIRLSSSLNIGVIGPLALGDETQTMIHRAIGYTIPGGWQHQIKNDLVLNYELAVEKQILRLGHYFSLAGSSNLRIGTLFTDGYIGAPITAGILNTPFIPDNKESKFAIHLFAHPKIKLVAYDATLQGGVFNTTEYTISNQDLNRTVAQIEYGIIIHTKKMYFEHFHARSEHEFLGGEAYRWGGFKLGFKI